MNKDLQAALEIARTISGNYNWVVTQIWDEGNCCFPTVSTDRCLSCYAIMRIGEICDKYDCIYEIDFSVSKLEISIMDKLF